MEEKLVDCVNYSMQNFLFGDAIFFAERLYAYLTNEHHFTFWQLRVTYRAGNQIVPSLS